jgi:hypothetical protein
MKEQRRWDLSQREGTGEKTLHTKNTRREKLPPVGKRHIHSSLRPQVEAILMHTSTQGGKFVSLCLMTIVLLSFTGPPVFCLVKDLERD